MVLLFIISISFSLFDNIQRLFSIPKKSFCKSMICDVVWLLSSPKISNLKWFKKRWEKVSFDSFRSFPFLDTKYVFFSFFS